MTTALMATEVFHSGAVAYGLLGTFLAVGSLTGSLLAARRTNVPLRLVVAAAMVFGALVTVAGLLPTYLTFAIWMPLIGLSALTMITAANTLMQLSTDPALRGRVTALYMMIFMGGTPLGAPAIGWVGDSFRARWMLILGGLLTMVGVGLAAALYLRHLRVLTGVSRAGNLFPRVWDNQAVTHARTQSQGSVLDSDRQAHAGGNLAGTR